MECRVIGDPVSHSLSPLMHSVGYQAYESLRGWSYAAVRVPASELEAHLEDIRKDGVRGISVTIPHKQAVMRFLDRVEIQAQRIGAVNTIVNQDGKLVGYNTDSDGIVEPLKKRFELAGSSVCVIGAGGAARAAVYGLASSKATVTVVNRTFEKARALAREFGCDAAELSPDFDFSPFNSIVQTTSVGMEPHVESTLVRADQLRKGQVVFDIVYVPLKTKLLSIAEPRGCATISGWEMFLAQGARQFELFTGKQAPIDMMQTVVLNRLSEQQISKGRNGHGSR